MSSNFPSNSIGVYQNNSIEISAEDNNTVLLEGTIGTYGGGEGGIGLQLVSTTPFNNAFSGTIVGGEGGIGFIGYGPHWGAGQIIPGVAPGPGGVGGVGVYISQTTLINDGTIIGGRGGLAGPDEFWGTGVAQNGGGGIGVFVNSGYLYNSGLIAGGGYGGYFSENLGDADAVYFLGAGTLKVGAASTLIGAVEAHASDELLLSGSSQTAALIGTEYYGFGSISFAAGAAWTLEGNIDAFSHCTTIYGLTNSDTIVINNMFSDGITYSEGAGLITADGPTLVTIAINGNTLSSVDVQMLNVGEAVITAPCFCKGTYIRTNDGEVAVEDIQIGDLVQTVVFGLQAVKWVGRRNYAKLSSKSEFFAMPICIMAGALGFNVPVRDLWVSPDHSIFLDGTLVYAWRLCNGVSIFQLESYIDVQYYHIELNDHFIIFAEDVPVESFLNLQCRERFDNAIDYYERYLEDNVSSSRYMRLDHGIRLHALQRRINGLAGIPDLDVPLGPLNGFIDECTDTFLRGWAQDSDHPEEPVTLEIIKNNQIVEIVLANVFRSDLHAAGRGSGSHGFFCSLPEGMTTGLLVRRLQDRALLSIAKNHIF